jgi:hypothetical protein
MRSPHRFYSRSTGSTPRFTTTVALFSFALFSVALFACTAFAAFLSASPQIAQAQELRANVTVDFSPNLPLDQREDVTTMKQDVMRYLSATSFTGKELKTDLLLTNSGGSETEKVRWKDEPVDVDVTITVLSRSGFTYTAQLLFVAKRPIYGNKESRTITFTTFDQNWSFEYRRNTDIAFNLYRYDPFATLLDFYALVAIGFDLDSFYELGGTQTFRLAQQVWQNGNGASGPGWQQPSPNDTKLTRGALVNELVDPRYEAFRKSLLSYYVEGIDFMSDDKLKAVKAASDAVAGFAKAKEKLPGRSALMQYVADAKFREFCTIFRGTPLAEQTFRDLKYFDVGNSSSYDKALQGKDVR